MRLCLFKVAKLDASQYITLLQTSYIAIYMQLEFVMYMHVATYILAYIYAECMTPNIRSYMYAWSMH